MSDKVKDELKARLCRRLIECGVDPEVDDIRVLQSYDKLIKTCQKRKEDIEEHQRAILKLKPNKAEIAVEAGLSRTSISKSHNVELLKIYENYFPKITEETVPLEKYNKLLGEKNDIQKQSESIAITQARIILVTEENRQLESKLHLQAESIQNLTKIIDGLKQKYLEATGEVLEVNAAQIIEDSKELEEEDIRKQIPVPLNKPSEIKS